MIRDGVWLVKDGWEEMEMGGQGGVWAWLCRILDAGRGKKDLVATKAVRVAAISLKIELVHPAVCALQSP